MILAVAILRNLTPGEEPGSDRSCFDLVSAFSPVFAVSFCIEVIPCTIHVCMLGYPWK